MGHNAYLNLAKTGPLFPIRRAAREPWESEGTLGRHPDILRYEVEAAQFSLSPSSEWVAAAKWRAYFAHTIGRKVWRYTPYIHHARSSRARGKRAQEDGASRRFWRIYDPGRRARDSKRSRCFHVFAIESFCAEEEVADV